jgi:hypothetical protein
MSTFQFAPGLRRRHVVALGATLLLVPALLYASSTLRHGRHGAMMERVGKRLQLSP